MQKTGAPAPKRRARTKLGSAMRLFHNALTKIPPRQAPNLALGFLLRSPLGQRVRMRMGGTPEHTKEYRVDLPAGYPARHIDVRIRIPRLPPSPLLEFAEHVTDEAGCAGDHVLATAKGGFAISHDLGINWNYVPVKGYSRFEFLHLKSLGASEYLAQAVMPRWKHKPSRVEILVVNTHGDVLAASRLAAAPWHSCRAVDQQGRTLMFAEYPYEEHASSPERRPPCRVFRSRDRGRSWDVAWELLGNSVRHFHFLQARPGRAGEWWLTSGDEPEESHIWVSRDDGGTWHDVSHPFATTVSVDGAIYPRTIFRLTDLAWAGDEVIWGTDHYLPSRGSQPRGARVLRSLCGDNLTPSVVGSVSWPIRNMVDIGDFWLFLTQGPYNAAGPDRRPGVYMVPKIRPPGAASLIHLFDVDAYSAVPTGFTYSKASRAAKDGVFFTARSGTDVFPFGHKLLKWEVTFS